MTEYLLSKLEQEALRRALRASVRIVGEEPKPRATPDYAAMDDTAEWAVSHYAETHGRRLGDG